MARGRESRLGPAALLGCGLDWAGRTPRGRLAPLAAVAGGLWALRAWGPAHVAGWGRGHEALVVVPLALLLVPIVGHAVRRLADMGWPGWWAWLLLVPWARWGLVALLLALPPSQRRPRGSALGRALGMGAAGAASLVLMGSLLWATAPVLAQDMTPALRPGDLALLRRAPVALAPGDVVAFRAGEGPPRFGRLVAGEGRRVALAGGVPVIDGAPARQAPDGFLTEPFAPAGPGGVLPLCGNGTVGLGAPCTTRRLREALPGGASYAVLDARAGARDDAPEVLVPSGHLFVLGDHRDAAADSRVAPGAGGAGLVPEAAVLGRVERVLASAAGPAWDPRGWRWRRVGAAVE